MTSSDDQDWSRHDDGNSQNGQGFQSTIQDALHGISQGQAHQVSFGLWNSFIQVIVMVVSTWLVNNPIIGKVCLAAFAMYYAWQYAFRSRDRISSWLKCRVCAHVTIRNEDDRLLESLTSYATANALFGAPRHTIAYSANYARNRTRKIVADKDVVVFESRCTRRLFKHNGYYFMLEQDSCDNNCHRLWSLSRSEIPLQSMLKDVHAEEAKKRSLHEVTVYSVETLNCYNPPIIRWEKQDRADRRTIASVCLPKATKTKLVKSCGKTSFAKAIATDYELTIYTISLANENVNDESLAKLLRSTDPRCIILMDDIDFTGLNDLNTKAEEPGKDSSSHSSSADSLMSSGSQNIKSAADSQSEVPPSNSSTSVDSNVMPHRQETRQKRPRLTRGGFLNAIDGVCGPTGHILIMTTNYPERIDPALIRPGRIDYKIEFTYANREQVHEIFMKTMKPFIPEELKLYDEKMMEGLAREFADKVPEHKLSPAQVQQCCTEYLDEPEKAVDEVLKWIEQDENQAARIAKYQEISRKWTSQHQQYDNDDQDEECEEDDQEGDGWQTGPVKASEPWE